VAPMRPHGEGGEAREGDQEQQHDGVAHGGDGENGRGAGSRCRPTRRTSHRDRVPSDHSAAAGASEKPSLLIGVNAGTLYPSRHGIPALQQPPFPAWRYDAAAAMRET
jgi:hypothetical protein